MSQYKGAVDATKETKLGNEPSAERDNAKREHIMKLAKSVWEREVPELMICGEVGVA